MPAPDAPTGVTLNQATAGIPIGTLSWSNTTANLDRFQVVHKRPRDANWRTLHLSDKVDFGSAGSYSMPVPLTESVKFKVKSIGIDGSSSAFSSDVTFSGSVDGVWLLPFTTGNAIAQTDYAWSGSASPDYQSERNVELFNTLGRKAQVSVSDAVVHLPTGTLNDGRLMERHGKTADQWLDNLETLIERQRKYKWIWLASPRYLFKVEVTSGLSVSVTVMGGRAYVVSYDFRELPNSYGR